MRLQKIQNGSEKPGRVKSLSCCWWISYGYLFIKKKEA